jgi:hypothetical protein
MRIYTPYLVYLDLTDLRILPGTKGSERRRPSRTMQLRSRLSHTPGTGLPSLCSCFDPRLPTSIVVPKDLGTGPYSLALASYFGPQPPPH